MSTGTGVENHFFIPLFGDVMLLLEHMLTLCLQVSWIGILNEHDRPAALCTVEILGWCTACRETVPSNGARNHVHTFI